jgi:hypothetical protein
LDLKRDRSRVTHAPRHTRQQLHRRHGGALAACASLQLRHTPVGTLLVWSDVDQHRILCL